MKEHPLDLQEMVNYRNEKLNNEWPYATRYGRGGKITKMLTFCFNGTYRVYKSKDLFYEGPSASDAICHFNNI